MNLFHVTVVTVGRLPIFLDEAPRRAALHVLGRLLRGRLVLFALVDDHVHLVLHATLEEVGRIGRDVVFALTPLSSQPLQPAHTEPVADEGHLRTLFRYVLEQPVKHGVGDHPALASGSCYAEMVGARLVPGLSLELERAFPREGTCPDPEPIVGLPVAPLVPMSPAGVRRLGAWRLAYAAAFAAGVCSLAGNDPAASAARRAAADLGRQAGFDNAELGYALGIETNSVRRLQLREGDEALVLAVRKRLALEQAVILACRTATVTSMAEAIARRKQGLTRVGKGVSPTA